MPGLAGRMSTVVKAKISRMLDRAEDPGETLDYGYQKQTELLQNVKKGIADVVDVEEAPSDAVQKLEQQVVKLDTQARQALAQGREDLARTALERRRSRRPSSIARPADQGARAPAGAAHRQRAAPAPEDRAVPDEEGGHQGAVLRRRGPGPISEAANGVGEEMADLRPRNAARRGQDGEHARPRVRGRGARSRERVRRHHPARLGPGRHRPPALRSSRAAPRWTTSWRR